ncbi:DUF2807 domain-containing protein [uncultured Flavobacterium sp.]|uniref:DUF2807 domain-containing protein n=1 Tax=uncultured Flavobacterium sp. TaxID=165435 RepID=UPI00292E267D|nr:DUF2807 domain-containing protein [uncultured Flavobacterium sp.]
MMLGAFVICLFASNVILKKRYDSADKSDYYWNYNKISTTPFKYLKIDGGNVTNIVFEQQKNCSVRVLDYWGGYDKDSVKTYVSGDTLHLQFVKCPTDLYKKSWMETNVLVRIAAPQLLAIDGYNTNFEFVKLDQKELQINLTGKSRIEVESNTHNFDKLSINQRDSSQVIFEMNPDLKQSPIIKVKNVAVKIQGVSLLDIGHMNVDNLQLDVTESSAVILSGHNLKSQQK